MSLIQCPECNKSISDNARSCPNCGYQLSPFKVAELIERKKEKKLIRNGFIAVCVVIIIILKICSTSKTPEDPTYWQTKNESTMAYIMTENWIKQRLKSPSTAKFPEMEIKNHTTHNGQVYKINSYVDSQNSFGAMLRTYFAAEVEQIEKEKWRLIDLKFSK